MDSYLLYDLETTGLNPIFDQSLQSVFLDGTLKER